MIDPGWPVAVAVFGAAIPALVAWYSLAWLLNRLKGTN